MSDGALSLDEIVDLLKGVDMAAKGAAKNPDAGSDASSETSVLSKDDISILLNAINVADAAKTAQEEKDFGERPNKFSKKHINEISIIHEKFALMAIKELSELVRTQVNLEVASVDQLFMDEFNRCIPVPSVIAVVSMEPLKGNIIIEIDPSMTSAIINKIGGGTGGKHKQWYELDMKEKKIIGDIFICLLKKLREAWAEVIDLSPRLVKVEPDPKFIRDYPPTEWLALVTLQTKVWDVESMINICIPFPVIEPVLEKLS